MPLPDAERTAPLYADVIVDISQEKIDRPFTYLVPEELRQEIRPGMPVLIPFGRANSLRRAYVIGLQEQPPEAAYQIKTIAGPAPRQVSAEDEFIELAAWMRERYGCTMNAALTTVLPVRKKIREKKGEKYRRVTADSSSYVWHSPNPEQAAAIETFTRSFDEAPGSISLLYGVTGSGKTDTYMHMIRHVLDRGRKVILLIPEISLTYQSIDRLTAAFGSKVAVIHSRLSAGERYDQFRRCRDGDADILVGPRSAIFAPFSDIGLIVVDEEQDSAYHSEGTPRYDARDVAIRRAEVHHADVLLVSATPSPETYRKALEGSYRLLSLRGRAVPDARMPSIDVVDMRAELQDGNRSIFSRLLDSCIRERLQRGEQIILFMNRRGYSSFVSCRSCGEAVRCPHCDVSLTVHRGKRMLCHYCGYSIPVPEVCPSCGSPYIAEFGTGTQKLETLTRKMYPEARVARLDTDVTAAKNASEAILQDMADHRIDILIGTQMVVKGHDFPDVTLVGIMAADTSLYVSDYNSGERTFELITQAAGRAGRAEKPGRVIVQTYKPDHYAVSTAAAQDYEAYYRHEMAFRSLLRYPPAVFILTIRLACREEEPLQKAAEELAAYAAAVPDTGTSPVPDPEVIGPADAPVYKINDFYRKIIYIKSSRYDILRDIREGAEPLFQKFRGEDDISIIYDII